jgi:hypothetical protein
MEDDLKKKNGRRPQKKNDSQSQKMENNLKKREKYDPNFRGKPFLGLAQLSKISF